MTKKKSSSYSISDTDKNKREKLTKVLLKPCKTKQELKAWIKYFLKLELPDFTVSRYSDTNPFDAIWEVYNICVNKDNPDKISELLFVAGRGSGKCVEKGTKILTKNGVKNIEDTKVGDIVYTGWDWQPIKHFFDEGIKPSIKIITSSGKVLTGSFKHRIQAINNDNVLDWVFLKDLKNNDKVYISNVTHYDELVNAGNLNNNGYLEDIIHIENSEAYFYDLEIETTHSYWSNGFISHNTLGMAIAELLVLLHDKRDVVHVGAIQSQADRCYAYQKNFLYNRQLKPLVMPSDVPEEQRISEKTNMSKSIFNIDGEKATLEVLPCTLKACLTSDNKILTESGVKLLKNIQKKELIKNVNGFVEVIDNYIDYAECMRIELDDGCIIQGTLDHKVLTTEGWVELQNLNETHDILNSKSVESLASIKYLPQT